jgi:hypothetical protein
MNSMKQLFLALACVGPIVLWVIYMLVSPFLPTDTPPNQLFNAGDLYPGVFGKITLAVVFVGFVTAIIFAVRVMLGRDVPKGEGTLWGVLLLLGNIIVLPIFWLKFVRQQRR